MEQQKHIDVITKYFYPIGGGIENNILQTYSVLQRDFGWDVTVHTLKDTYIQKEALPECEVVNGLRVQRYSSSIFGFRPDIAWGETDVVALHNFDLFFVRYLFTALFYKLVGTKTFALVLTPHGGFNPEWSMFGVIRRYIKKLYTYTLGAWLVNTTVDGVRAVSLWERSEEVKHIDSAKVHMIDNGLEDEAYSDVDGYASDAVRADVASYGTYLIQVARVYPIKNIETTILALTQLPKEVKFLVVGELQDPDYEAMLRSLIREHGLEDRVIMRGVVRGVDKYYLMKHAMAMVHMSLWESGCNVVREGMSQGLPCVVSNTYGLPGLVKDGINGFCIPPRDTQAVVRKVMWILDPENAHMLERIKEANRVFGMGQSWREVARKMDTMYRECMPQRVPNQSDAYTPTQTSFVIHLRNGVYWFASLIGRVLIKHRPTLVVYCYHSIASDGWRFAVRLEDFKEQIQYLLHRSDPFDPHDLGAYMRNEKILKRDAFLITFDDGYKDILTVREFLRSCGIKPIAFVLGDSDHADAKELQTLRDFLSIEDMRTLQNSGWMIGSHSMTHTDFFSTFGDELRREVGESKIVLETALHTPITVFAYPKGAYTEDTIASVAKAGYQYAFTVDDGYVTPGSRPHIIPRVGVDGTHTLRQFAVLAAPASMILRRFVRKLLGFLHNSI